MFTLSCQPCLSKSISMSMYEYLVFSVTHSEQTRAGEQDSADAQSGHSGTSANGEVDDDLHARGSVGHQLPRARAAPGSCG